MGEEYGLSRIVLRKLREAAKTSPGYIGMFPLQEACECSRIDLLRAIRQLEKRGYKINKTWINEAKTYHLSLTLV